MYRYADRSYAALIKASFVRIKEQNGGRMKSNLTSYCDN